MIGITQLSTSGHKAVVKHVLSYNSLGIKLKKNWCSFNCVSNQVEKSDFRPYHHNAPSSPDKTCYLVMMLTKVWRTPEHMSSRSSVENHWHFQNYLQSMSLPVLDTERNRTKIVLCSFPMSLFLGSTVWSSLLILRIRISWYSAAAALTPGLLDSEAATPLLHPLRVPMTRVRKTK
jgi:hypothetical protein